MKIARSAAQFSKVNSSKVIPSRARARSGWNRLLASESAALLARILHREQSRARIARPMSSTRIPYPHARRLRAANATIERDSGFHGNLHGVLRAH